MAEEKDAFDAFSEDVQQLHTNWTLWRHLFNREQEAGMTPEESVRAGDEAYRVTGESSELFFRHARWAMLKAAVLDLSRLCDPMEMFGGKKENLTVERILKEAETEFSTAPPHLAEQLRRASEAAHRIVRDKTGLAGLRHKVFAHNDLAVATGREPPVGVDVVEAVDAAVRRVVQFQHLVAILRQRRPFSIQSPDASAPRSVEAPCKAEIDRLVAVLGQGLGQLRIHALEKRIAWLVGLAAAGGGMLGAFIGRAVWG